MYGNAKSVASVDFRGFWPKKRLAKTVGLGRGGAMRRAQFGREVFCPQRPTEVIKPWHARTFGHGACTHYDPKVILGAKTLDPKGHAYHGS